MQTGIRDVVSLPLSLEQLESSARAAAQWSRALRERVSGEETAVGALAGNLIAVAGAKGGVGTTTVAIHLALAAARNAPGRPVCLVDFDLQKGDLRAYMDTPYRRSVVDLVEVADEISVRHLQETLFTHREGVRMLLAPDEGERAEEVDSNVARNVLGAVRARHALTVVDLGATVSEASAIGAEMASKVLVVSTPDVVALRGVRRLRDLWRRLQVREDDQDTLVLLNQASRKREVQPDLARKVVGGRLAETTIPADFAAFEATVNTGSPARLEDQKLRGAFEALATELEALPTVDEPADADGEPRGLLARLSGERGQTTVEFAGILPLLFVVVLLLWQIGLVGYTFMLAGHSAREGARELAIDTTDTRLDRPYARQGDGGPAEGVAEGRQGRPSRGQHRARGAEGPRAAAVGAHEHQDHLRGGHRDRGRAAARVPEGRPVRLLRRLHRDQRGQASVEFAGVLVWLLLAALLDLAAAARHVDLQPGLQRGAHRQPRRRPRRQRRRRPARRRSRRACATTRRSR